MAQNYFSALGEHNLSINHKVSGIYKYNFSVSTRHYIYNNEATNAHIRQLDFKHFSTYSLSLDNSISLGLQYRNRDWFEHPNNEIRITQQFNTITRLRALRFGHRFRAEQRITNPKTTHRFRYRFAVDFPLNGEQLNIGEAYIVATNEALYSVARATKPELDYRITTQLGWLYSKNLKLQFGLEYRFEGFNIEKNQKLHVLTSGVIKI
ncbi:DUF2490 domain-containing protein [Lacinutrix sp. 5H-3-7-4]|uniref:DUF2490 domain-containing protein n=1 Tax=Lacinutrix sp. (strain 5H-3-7-4) TaxID=983544 RepID=UPI0002DAAF68|nr:DUF2490 domain-containing protein [Lacinutrix sp. 5H-3-7-4]